MASAKTNPLVSAILCLKSTTIDPVSQAVKLLASEFQHVKDKFTSMFTWDVQEWHVGVSYEQHKMVPFEGYYYLSRISHISESMDSCPGTLSGERFWARMWSTNRNGETTVKSERIKKGIVTSVRPGVLSNALFSDLRFHTRPTVMPILNVKGRIQINSSSVDGFTFVLLDTDNVNATQTVRWVAIASMASSETSSIEVVDGTPTTTPNNARRLRLHLRDADGVPFTSGGAKVTFFASNTSKGLNPTFTEVIDMQNGTYEATVMANTIGTMEINACVNGENSLYKPFTIRIVTASQTLSSAVVSNRYVEPTDDFSIHVNAVGVNQQPISGLDVRALSPATNIDFSRGFIDNGDGSYVISCRALQLGNDLNIRVTLQGAEPSNPSFILAVSPQVSVVRPGIPSASLSTMLSSSSSLQMNASVKISLRLLDTDGTPILSNTDPIEFAQSGTGQGTFSQVQCDGDGYYSTTFLATSPGTVALSGSVANLCIQRTLSLNITTWSQSLSQVTAAAPSIFVTQSVRLSVTVRDTLGVVMPNVMVSLYNVNSLSQPILLGNGVSDSQGVFGLDFAGAIGTYGLTATVGNQKLVSLPVKVTILPTETPQAPSVVAVRKNGPSIVVQLSASSAPGADGGLPITSFTVTAQPGGQQISIPNQSPLQVTFDSRQLQGGVSYTFSATATNNVGSSSSSPLSSPLFFQTIPDPPQVLSVQPKVGGAIVTIAEGDRNGGAPVTSFTIISSPDGISTSSHTSGPVDISGLRNGVSYTFIALAENIMGSSFASVSSEAVVPKGPPGAPTNVIAVPGNSCVLVSMSPPQSDGGSPITEYHVVCESDPSISGVWSANPQSLEVKGLKNGVSYTFSAFVVSAIGNSSKSDVTDAVTPFTVPGVPKNFQAFVQGSEAAVLYFDPPDSDGGAPIDSFYVQTTPDGSIQHFPSAFSPIIINSLSKGTVYQFVITAVNHAGQGPPTNPFMLLVASPPAAPTISRISPGNKSVTVDFSAPSDNGGSVITAYKINILETQSTYSFIVSDPSVLNFSQLIPSLTNGTAYTFSVQGYNSMGWGKASLVSAPVTPAPQSPDCPSITSCSGNADALTASISFVPGASDGGSAITSFTCRAIGSDQSVREVVVAANLRTASIVGLTAGVNYTLTVKATSAVGDSLESPPFGPLVGAPSSISSTEPVPSTGAVTVSWRTPPALPQSHSQSACTPFMFSVTSLPSKYNLQTNENFLTLNLDNDGVSYVFQVRASYPSGILSSASNAVSWAGAPPDTPSNVSLSVGTSNDLLTPIVSCSWAPPGQTEPVVSTYEISLIPSDSSIVIQSFSTSSPSIRLTLAWSSSYTLSIVAQNAGGVSVPFVSQRFNTPALPVPSPPTNLSLSVLAQPADVTPSIAASWSAPLSQGGSAITSYRINLLTSEKREVLHSFTVDDGSNRHVFQVDWASSYILQVIATNTEGPSQPLMSEVVQTPPVWTNPSPPTGLYIDIEESLAIVPSVGFHWTAPSDMGNSAFVGYDALLMSADQSTTIASVTTTDPVAIFDLAWATSYMMKVATRNQAGSSAFVFSQTFQTAPPPTVTSAPTSLSMNLSVQPSSLNPSVAVSWSAPVDNGNSPFVEYDASLMSVDQSTTIASAVVTDPSANFQLEWGKSYLVKILAKNQVGASAPLFSQIFQTPVYSIPDSPIISVQIIRPAFQIGLPSIVANWSFGASGGTEITSADVALLAGDQTTVIQSIKAPIPQTTTTFQVDWGKTYYLRVVANNFTGSSLPAISSPIAIPAQ